MGKGVIIIILLLGIFLPSCKIDEEKVLIEIEDALCGEHTNVISSYEDGVVVLAGFVETEQKKLSAEKVVRHIKYVKSIYNQISVKESLTSAKPSDETLQHYIHARLCKEGCNEVKVDVRNGEVTLTGNVHKDDFIRAMRIVRKANTQRVMTNLLLVPEN